ncbi:phosphatidate phosphatase LPIN [Nematocida sp. AWRm80]|nr:phosphatidate phosphatase LPIN [Nematocida sp. AWRm80]
MNFVGRVFNSMSDLYKDMNPSHMSGANDLVAVKVGESIRTTGFYARFGNVHSVKTSREVILTVNDRVVNVDTRLDKEGNVFFSFQSSPKTDVTKIDYSTTTRYKTVKTLIESPENYSYLLAHYESIHECIVENRYIFSECLHKKASENKITEIFDLNRISGFFGGDTIVVGLCEKNASTPIYLLSFSLFSELYFCVERRPRKCLSEETSKEDCSCPVDDYACEHKEKETQKERKNTIGKYLIKQLLRKRVQPQHNGGATERVVHLPEKYLQEMNLTSGANKVVYRLSGTPVYLTCTLFLWSPEDKVVISDIDGTITKSDIIGYIYGAMGKDWTHAGISALYNKIVENGYKILYLSSRPVGHIELTKTYLEKVEQNGQKLPVGPVFLFPGRLLSAIYREVILGPEEYKISAITEIKQMLIKGEIFAGFGNKESDRIAYELCDIDCGRIFIVNPMSEISTGKSGMVKLTHQSLYSLSEGIFPVVSQGTHNVSQKYIGNSWWDASRQG